MAGDKGRETDVICSQDTREALPSHYGRRPNKTGGGGKLNQVVFTTALTALVLFSFFFMIVKVVLQPGALWLAAFFLGLAVAPPTRHTVSLAAHTAASAVDKVVLWTFNG